MPRKPEEPRPSRRYEPRAMDLPLDRLKSASAIVTPPGFQTLPFSLAALFAEAGPEARALSFQIATRHGAPSGHDAEADTAQPAGPAGAGGGSPGAVTGGASLPVTTAPAAPAAPDPDLGPLVTHSDTDTSGPGGGVLPGRGGSGAAAGPRWPTGPNARPSIGSPGASRAYGFSLGGGANPAGPAVPPAGNAGGTGRSSSAATPPPAVAAPGSPSGAAGAAGTAPSSIATSVASAQSPSQAGRAGHPAVQGFGPKGLPGSSVSLAASPSFSLGSLTFASLTFGPPSPSTSLAAPGPHTPSGSTTGMTLQTGTGAGGGTSGQSGGMAGGGFAAADAGGGGGIEVMPIGGGQGGIYAQAWRLHPATPYDAPYGGGGPANQTPDGAPFQTLNALILGYIDQALANLVPANTSGTNVVTHPASLSVTAFDGLGTFTFSVTASFNIDGQYLSGSFSTTDGATLLYSFHEAGFTPDGRQFTLDDHGGGTLNIHANNGNSTTHSLTNTLIGSDSYALTQVLVQSDAVSGSYTATEGATDTLGGSDGFSMTETQTETVNTSGTITGGSDSYVYDETGSDTSSHTDQGGETVAGGGVGDNGTSSSGGSGSGGHTDHVTGTDAMGAGGFLPQGTRSFTWGGSDSESLTTTATVSDGVTAAGDGVSDSATSTETTSESASEGQTGTESFSSSEGTSFSWREWVTYADNHQGRGWDQGTETTGEADTNPDGGDGGQAGSTFSATDTDTGQGQVNLYLSESGSQGLTNGLVGGGSGSFYWTQFNNVTDTDIQTSTESSSGTESGSEAQGGDWSSHLQVESGGGAATVTTTVMEVPDSIDRGGVESFGSFGLVLGGSESVQLNEKPESCITEQDSDSRTVTDIATATDAAAGGLVTDYASSVETDQDTSGSTGYSAPATQPGGTRTLGAGGLIVAYALTDHPNSLGWSTASETDVAQDSGTETGTGPDEADAASFSTSDSDVVSTSEFDYEGGGVEPEQGSIAIGAGGAVVGGSESTSLVDTDIETCLTTTETDGGVAEETSTETTSEGGDSATISLTSSESDGSTTTETSTDTATETDTSSLTLGGAGVVLSGSAYDYLYDPGSFLESGSDTGSGTVQEVQVTTGDVGGNTTSDSLSTSESDSSTGTDSGGGTEGTTATENTGYGPGGIVTGGSSSDSGSDVASTTDTVTDTSGGSHTEAASDAQAEASDTVTDSSTGKGTDSGTVQETDSETVTASDLASEVLGAAGDVLGGFASATESDTGSDNSTDAATSTETTTATDSSTEALGGATTTDQETDTASATDTTTDTEDDAPAAWEQSSESYGAGGIVLAGSGSTTLGDTVTDGATTSDVIVDRSTGTLSEWGGVSSSSLNDYDLSTDTATSTLTGTDASTATDSEATSQALGPGGVITGGSERDTETGTDTGTSGTTLTEQVSDTATESSVENDSGDSSTHSTSEVASETIRSSDPAADSEAFYESMTETLGAGGVVTGGGLTRTYSDSSGTTVGPSGTLTTTLTGTTTETDSVSETFSDASINIEGNTSIGQETGSDTSTETETGASRATGTLTEALGADGTIVSGAESDSVSESSGDTTTETDHPIETVTASASDVTMTLTDSTTQSATDNESDQEWACETLGTSGTIAGGSDCFTVSGLETSGDSTTGSGPEDYNDTSSAPNGTATVTGSGSSSNLTYQRFGDILGGGGDITSGSLTYTVTSSDSDATTTTETGTETIADELVGGSSQTASYSVTTTIPAKVSAWETGTETLGGGGTISGGTASFSWSDGDSLGRNLTISGIAATLGITENSTDTYGFGESGTETITTGGADAPGTVTFTWVQMGTDNYQIHQGNSVSSSTPYATNTLYYLLDLTDTVSSTWNDAGVDVLTDGDSLVGETDIYTRGQLNSLTDTLTETVSEPIVTPGLTHQKPREFGPIHSINSRSSTRPGGGGWRYSSPCCASPP